MFVKISEQPSLYNDLEKKSVHELLTEINQEDHKVADAVQKAIPQIEELVTRIVPRMRQGHDNNRNMQPDSNVATKVTIMEGYTCR